jgi:site-specific DNA recombinase
VRCGLCARRMQGNPNHGLNHYRCVFPAEYALANKIDHPKSVYVKESAIVPKLDAWLTQLFDPDNLDATVAALADVGQADEEAEARAEAARRKLVDCDDRLGKYRAALDSGADPAVVAGWMAEVQGERLQAEAELAVSAASQPMSEEELRLLVQCLGDMTQVLAEADPRDKAQVYSELGISVTYDPDQRLVSVTAQPFTGVQQSVSEGRLRP